MIYALAPVISTVPAITAFAVIPLGPEVSIFGHRTALQLADLPIAVLFVLAMSSIGVYGIILAAGRRVRSIPCSVESAPPPR